MKIKSFIVLSIIATLFIGTAFAKQVTVQDANGSSVSISVPDDVAGIIESRISEINSALKTNGITSDEITEAASKITDAYDSIRDKIPTATPFSDVQNGLDDFTEDLAESIINAQSLQNVYAEAWIGRLIPGFHFAAGINAGVSALDVSDLRDAAVALGIDEIENDTLVFPTITADARLGGIILPFDIGITAFSIDTSKLDSFTDSVLDSVAFDYWTLGGDIRYALLKGGSGLFIPRWSVGAGFYYTKGSVEVKNDDASAGLDFSSKTLMLSTQASVKLLHFLVPFVGGRVLISKSSVDWNAKANWDNIIGAEDGTLADAISWGLLPSSFSGGSSVSGVYPQLFAGLGLNFFLLDITVSGSYDFVSKIPSGAVSIRIGL